MRSARLPTWLSRLVEQLPPDAGTAVPAVTLKGYRKALGVTLQVRAGGFLRARTEVPDDRHRSRMCTDPGQVQQPVSRTGLAADEHPSDPRQLQVRFRPK